MNDEVNKMIKSPSFATPSPRGSVWHRWDPHIHIPGTLHADNFSGDDPDIEFIKRINNTSPPIRVLGIIDYLCSRQL